MLVTVGIVRGGHIKFTFMPKVDADNLVAALTLPQGTTVEDAQRAVDQLEASLEAMREEMKRDSLTDAYNRGAFDAAIAQSLNMHFILQQPVTLVLVDLDHDLIVVIGRDDAGDYALTIERNQEFIRFLNAVERAIALADGDGPVTARNPPGSSSNVISLRTVISRPPET